MKQWFSALKLSQLIFVSKLSSHIFQHQFQLRSHASIPDIGYLPKAPTSPDLQHNCVLQLYSLHHLPADDSMLINYPSSITSFTANSLYHLNCKRINFVRTQKTDAPAFVCVFCLQSSRHAKCGWLRKIEFFWNVNWFKLEDQHLKIDFIVSSEVRASTALS